MKKKKKINTVKILGIILAGVWMMLFWSLVFVTFMILDVGVFDRVGGFTGQTRRPNVQFVRSHQEQLAYIFLETFSKAEQCNNGLPECKLLLADDIQSVIQTSELPSGTSTYFITVDSKGTIRKLFLSGDYTVTTASTVGERKVYNYLLGRRLFLNAFPYKIDSTNTNMLFLRDLQAESEVVLRVKKDRKIIGAMVIVHGD